MLPHQEPPRKSITPSSAHSPQSLRLIALALALALGVLVVILIYRQAGSSLSELSDQLERLQAVNRAGGTLIEMEGEAARAAAAQVRGFTLPSSASALRLARQGDSRPFYWLRFDVPAADLAALLENTCFETPLAAGYNPPFAYAADEAVIANLDWWTPEPTDTTLGGRCQPQPNVTFTLLVDRSNATSDPMKATVYLEVMPGDLH